MKTIAKRILQIFSGNTVVYEGGRGIKGVAFTFDDGPNSAFTPQVLDILKRYNIRATFFFLGAAMEKQSALVKRTIDEGHTIGNHTYSHPSAASIKDSLDNEIASTFETIDKYRNGEDRLFRPPRGTLSWKLLSLAFRSHFKIVLWSVDSMDWKKGNTIVDLKKVQNGDIVLFHDDNEYTLRALPSIIEKILARGFAFVTINEMLKSKGCK